MKTNSNIKSYSSVLSERYGEVGTPEREVFQKEALEFYAAQILLHSRKGEHMTQSELAEKTGLSKSYISRIERGTIQPTMATFLKLIGAMNKRIEIV